MAASLQTCKICHKTLAEVLMIKVPDPGTDLGYSFVCHGHNVPDPNKAKEQRRRRG